MFVVFHQTALGSKSRLGFEPNCFTFLIFSCY